MRLSLMILLITYSVALNAQENDIRGLGSLEEYLGQNIVIGRQYLLLIASDKYTEWPNLANAVKDARETRDILSSLYFIDEIIQIYDEEATKENIIRTFEQLQVKLDVHDSLIIFYAGHGYLDKISGIGFWIPTNGGKSEYRQDNWIANAQVRGIIGRIKASHILLISDSCFSGDILDRGRDIAVPTTTKHAIIEAYKRTARQVITSGALEMVPDTSEFACQLKMALRKNTEAFLDPMTLYTQIKPGVSKTFPLFGNLKETGHQLGASFFLFFRKPRSLPSARLSGNIRVVPGTAGKLFLDGGFYNDIGEEDCVIDYIEPGTHTLEILYPDGISETASVEVRENITSRIIFSHIPEEQIRENKTPGNYFSFSAGFGIAFPFGIVGNIMDTGYMPILSVSYKIPFRWGDIGIGIITGTNIASIKEELPNGYTMHSVPVGINASYKTRFGIPFFIMAEVSSGLSLNLFDYSGATSFSHFIPSPFAMGVIGTGYMVNPRVGIGLYGRFTEVFFSDIQYMNIAPCIGLEVNTVK